MCVVARQETLTLNVIRSSLKDTNGRDESDGIGQQKHGAHMKNSTGYLRR